MRPLSPSAKRHLMDPLDALGPAPYDPVAGFVIFYDFLLGLDPTHQTVRLLSGLYSNGHRMGQTTSLPDVPCDMWHPAPHLENVPRGNTAMLAAKQPIPRVRPASSIALVVELQASGGFNPYGQEVQHVSSCGWSKLDLFDQHNQVLSGRWKLPVRALPLRPGLSTGQLNTVPQVALWCHMPVCVNIIQKWRKVQIVTFDCVLQVGKAELYIRVVNARDAELQSLAEINLRNASFYQYPPLISGGAAAITENPTYQPAFHRAPNAFHLPLSPYTDYVDPPPVEELPKQQKPSQRAAVDGQEVSPDGAHTQTSVGFIIDRVKDVPQGDGTLRLMGYHMKTGQVIRTRTGSMTFVSSSVSSSVKHGHLIFGEQEVLFSDIDPGEDMILILRFYHWPAGSAAWSPWQHRRRPEPLPASEEWLVAWAALHLTKPASSEAPPDPSLRRHGDPAWNTGVHDLPLFHAPAPPALSLTAILPEDYHKVFEQYGNARARLWLFSATRPDFPFPPQSPLSENPIAGIPEGVFIPHCRRAPPTEPHASSDTIHLHIDGARFLPDAVTVTRVTGRIFNKNFDQFGPDLCTDIDLDSDVFQPFYNLSLRIRSQNLPPSATLLLKVYAIDRFAGGLSLIGWASLNLFVESGSEEAPSSDQGDVGVSLNEGAHQIRIYHRAPRTDLPLSVESLASAGRAVPCATLLLRLMKVLSHVNPPPSQIDRHLHPASQCPEYSTGLYYSASAHPSEGEIQLYSAMMNRSVVLVKEVIRSLAGSERQALVSDEHLSHWVQKTFTEQMTETPRPFNPCCVSQYLPETGIKISADRAQNLPWSGLTLAHICLNPPGAYYLGNPWLKYDRPVPVDNIDLNSQQTCPAWTDGFKTFTHRLYREDLTALFQLHEIVLRRDAESSERGAGRTTQGSHKPPDLSPGVQAWTALRVFYRNYCNMGVYQLPLYHGAPGRAVLQALSSGGCAAATLKDLQQTEMIKLVPGTSLIVRIVDGRRFEELDVCDAQDINQSYLPEDAAASYTRTMNGKKISDLIPDGQEDFKKDLADWFRKVFYQLGGGGGYSSNLAPFPKWFETTFPSILKL
uniref:Uncharacterized protein n=1 Tax=Leptobrachium leishanense TaxID=445787 RepID=A0A8C5QHA4_9ANUR